MRRSLDMFMKMSRFRGSSLGQRHAGQSSREMPRLSELQSCRNDVVGEAGESSEFPIQLDVEDKHGGIEYEKNAVVKFDVYVNDVGDDDDVLSGPDKSEFAGSFVSVPHTHKEKRNKSKAEDDESVVVTLVPKFGAQTVTIGSIRIEFVA
ncbi:hypothetical protein Prudu_010954 [Prunus dulcis]|uniref:Polyphenol oxidase C-terminal domain-containing protein n=1 Tax=Prunus dulcis TaxID=3755 RepID=A0A4Y1R9L1_PRUDU|nr:hypothetical protein Prudu_010954 [Prunus dulcis]